MKKIIILFITIFFVLASFSPIISSFKIKCEKKTCNETEEKDQENSYYHHLNAYADFTWSPRYPDPGEEIIFTSTSYCYNGGIINERWDLGEGYHQNGPIAKHTFNDKGRYKVTLRVEARGWRYYDDHFYYDWDTDYCTRYIDVGADPFPRFTISNSYPAPNENITLDASESTDPDGNIVSYNWSYYNAENPEKTINLGNEEKFSYRWKKQGVYNIVLSATDDKGNCNNLEKTLTISILKIDEITDDTEEINVNIFNQGEIDVENLNYDIEINRYSRFNFFQKQFFRENDEVDVLKPGNSKNITIKDLKGYGGIIIDISADADNAVEVSKSKFGYIIGDQIFLSDFEIDKINRFIKMFTIGSIVLSIILFVKMFIKIVSSDSEE